MSAAAAVAVEAAASGKRGTKQVRENAYSGGGVAVVADGKGRRTATKNSVVSPGMTPTEVENTVLSWSPTSKMGWQRNGQLT